MFKNNGRKFPGVTSIYDMAYTQKQLTHARQRVSDMDAKQIQTRIDRMSVQGKLEAFAIALRERLYGLSILGIGRELNSGCPSLKFKKHLSLFRVCVHKCGFSPTFGFFTNQSIRDSSWDQVDVRYLVEERYLKLSRPNYYPTSPPLTTADKKYLRFMYGHDSILNGVEMGAYNVFVEGQVNEHYIALLRGTGSPETNPPAEASTTGSSLVTFQSFPAKAGGKRLRRNLNL